MTAHERTGWRDAALSERHRAYGFDCPAVDVDFILCEYDAGKAVALVEYKHESAPPQSAAHPSYQALCDLGNRAGLPVFAVRYASSFEWWKVTPLNEAARRFVAGQTVMGEAEWVRLLYKVRGRELPAHVLSDLQITV